MRFDEEETQKILDCHKDMTNRMKREGVNIEVSYQDIVKMAVREFKR